jgi:hypothetical protein
MNADEIFRALQGATPLEGIRRIHTFKGSLGYPSEDITIEITEWAESGTSRYHIRAHDQHGNHAFGTGPYDSLETAIRLFPWDELAMKEHGD